MNDRLRIGDRVRVNGQLGRVTDVLRQANVGTWPGQRPIVRVRYDNGVTNTTSQAVRYEEPTPEPTAEEVLINVARLQAAHAAHTILTEDASLDQLIGMAEFLLGERTLGTETTGTIPVPPQRVVTGVTPAPAPTPSPEADRKTLEHGLEVRGLSVYQDLAADDDVARLYTEDGSTAYLTEEHARQVIDFLEAAIRSHKGANPPAPF